MKTFPIFYPHVNVSSFMPVYTFPPSTSISSSTGPQPPCRLLCPGELVAAASLCVHPPPPCPPAISQPWRACCRLSRSTSAWMVRFFCLFYLVNSNFGHPRNEAACVLSPNVFLFSCAPVLKYSCPLCHVSSVFRHSGSESVG